MKKKRTTPMAGVSKLRSCHTSFSCKTVNSQGPDLTTTPPSLMATFASRGFCRVFFCSLGAKRQLIPLPLSRLLISTKSLAVQSPKVAFWNCCYLFVFVADFLLRRWCKIAEKTTIDHVIMHSSVWLLLPKKTQKKTLKIISNLLNHI